MISSNGVRRVAESGLARSRQGARNLATNGDEKPQINCNAFRVVGVFRGSWFSAVTCQRLDIIRTAAACRDGCAPPCSAILRFYAEAEVGYDFQGSFHVLFNHQIGRMPLYELLEHRHVNLLDVGLYPEIHRRGEVR